MTDIEIKKVIQDVLIEIRDQEERDFEIKEDTLLIGASGVLDSIGLVAFLVELEEALQERLGVAVTIASEKAFSKKSSPFLNILSLTEFIKELVEETK